MWSGRLNLLSEKPLVSHKSTVSKRPFFLTDFLCLLQRSLLSPLMCRRCLMLILSHFSQSWLAIIHSYRLVVHKLKRNRTQEFEDVWLRSRSFLVPKLNILDFKKGTFHEVRTPPKPQPWSFGSWGCLKKTWSVIAWCIPSKWNFPAFSVSHMHEVVESARQTKGEWAVLSQ